MLLSHQEFTWFWFPAFSQKFANLFPSIVTGSVITTIGRPLIPSLSEIWEIMFQSQLVKAFCCYYSSDYSLRSISLPKGIYQVYSILMGLVGLLVHCCYHRLSWFLPRCGSTACPCSNSPLFDCTDFWNLIHRHDVYHCNGVYGWVDWCSLPVALSDITMTQSTARACATVTIAEGLAVLLGGIFNTFHTGFSQKRWFGQIIRYQDPSANLLRSWFPSPPWTPS